MPTIDTYRLLRALVDELVRCGVTAACTSPGSRSTPLVATLAREPRLRTFSHVDERCAAFFALGFAKATGRPAVIACTSGTAAANYAPAVIEAREARVPLIVLTADRPAELRDVGAGQTIDQLKLYGSAAKWFAELDVEQATPERLRWIRQLGCRAYATAVENRPGPVHLNVPLREPLVLDELLPADDGGRPDGRPWVARPATVREAPPAVLARLAESVAARPRGLVVAGRSEQPGALPAAVARFAETSGYPVLGDPLSGLRHGPAAVAHYDALLREPAFATAHRPQLVLRVGDLPTSKPLRTWLDGLPGDTLQVTFDAEAAWQDPFALSETLLAADPAATLDALAERLAAGRGRGEAGADGGTDDGGEAGSDDAGDARTREATDWHERWHDADVAAGAAIETVLGDELCEPRVARELVELLPAEATLVVAASMPIRDVESFGAVRRTPLRVLANRGANGIDGTTSTAYGIAAGATGPVVLLLGDVTFAHDLGGLLAARRLGLPLTIVLIDNGGGGIFDFLPVAGQTDVFEEHVATPTGLDAALAARLFGCEHERVTDLAGFRAALERGLAGAGTSIVEVRSDRARNVALHREANAAVARAVGG